jgi:hypothetical protein
MKETLTTEQAADRLVADDNANWSYAGARALVEYLEDIENDTGEELEFDRVAIRCDYNEYESAREAAEDYGFAPDEDDDPDDIEEAAQSWLEEKTTVIAFASGVIVQAF